MSAARWLQHRIEAQQLLDDIDYGLRSIKACGSALHCTGLHAGQLSRACDAAALFLDSTGESIYYAQDTALRLREAKAIARETLAETKAIIREEIGTVRQLRLAIAAESAHEMELAA